MRNVSRSLFGQDSSMSPKRQRSVSNLNVGVREYLSALMSWRSQHSGQSYQQLLGPTWCREIRQVTPHSLSRCYGLLNALVEVGVHNGVLFPSKFEVALKESIVRDPSALSASSNHATIITDISDHIRVNFGMVRQLAFEDDEMPCRRRYCKTGVLRRMATASELVLINNLIRKMNFDENATVSDGGEVRESPRHMSSSEELLVTERIFPVAGRVSVDDEGFPIVFSKFYSVGVAPAGTPTAAPAATVLAVADLPTAVPAKSDVSVSLTTVPAKSNVAASSSSTRVPIPIDVDAPVCPNPRIRKQLALSNRSPGPGRQEANFTPEKNNSRNANSGSMPDGCTPEKNNESTAPLKNARYTGPTKEKNPRVQLLASTDSIKRLFVFTLTEKSFGHGAEECVKKVVAAINDRGITKREALQIRDEFTKSSR